MMQPENKHAGAIGKHLTMPTAFGFGVAQPDKAPHSATRFILPFKLPGPPASNNPTPARAPQFAGKTAYRKAGAGDWIQANEEARHNYLTAETREVLFNRATWWVMNCEPQPIAMTAPDGHKLRGIVRPPALVLFEDKWAVELLRRGFLVVEVAFRGDDNALLRLDDLLLFNELFRYWREPFKGDGKDVRSHSELFGQQLQDFAQPFREMTGSPQQTLSAETPSAGKDLYSDRWLSLLQMPLADDHAPLARATSNASEVFGDYADDRAFVWTRALFSGDENELKRIVPHTWDSNHEWRAEAHPETGCRKMFGYWVKLLNADKPALQDKQNGKHPGYKPCDITNMTTAFEREWAAKRTYRRWEHVNCYYGFNSFSAAMMSEPCTDPPTWQHWFEMYFDQMLLLFYVRVTLFQFSSRLTAISGSMLGDRAEHQSDKLLQEWQSGFRRLRRAFTCFENLYQFPLLSNQQQAVEMYDYLRKGMDISDLYDEVSREIQSSDELLESEVQNHRSKVEERRNQLSSALNQFAVIGFGVSAALGMFQIQALTNLISNSCCPLCVSLLSFAALTSFWCLLFRCLLKRFMKNS